MASFGPLAFVVPLCFMWIGCSFSQAAASACTVPRVVDFEDCLWQRKLAASSGYAWRVSGNGLPWSRVQTPTVPFVGFAGTSDHTFGTDKGNFFVTSRTSMSTTLTSTSTVLESEEFTSDSRACSVSFYYQFVGNVSDRLVVTLVTNNNTETHMATTVTMLTDTTGWTQRRFALPANMTKFRIRFDAQLQVLHSRGYFALDDVQFSHTCCAEYQPPLLADFECGMQGYSISTSTATQGRWNWSVTDGTSQQPKVDVTLGAAKPAGHILFYDSFTFTLKPAKFWSLVMPPTLASPSSCAVSFWHIRSGGRLRLWLEPQGQRQLLWDSYSVNISTGADWKQVTANLTSSSEFRISFEVEAYQSPPGLETSIDNIAFTPSCWTASPQPAVDYGLPKCNWIGYDTRSERPRRDRSVAALAQDVAFPCNGTVQSITAFTNGPCKYFFYLATRLPPVPPSKSVYVTTRGLRFEAVFNGVGEQTIPVSNMSFVKGDTVIFERDAKSGLNGRIMASAYDAGSFCISGSSVAELQSLYPGSSFNAVQFVESDCLGGANQYGLKFNFISNTPTTTAGPLLVTMDTPASPPSSFSGSAVNPSRIPVPTSSAVTPPVVIGPIGADGSSMTSSIVPYAITGGVLGVVFIALVVLAIVALARRRRAALASKTNVPQVNDFQQPPDTLNRNASGKPLVNPSYEDEIPLHLPPFLSESSPEYPELNGRSASIRASQNGRQANGNFTGGNHGMATRTRSDVTEMTTVSFSSTPSDTSPQRADGCGLMVADFRVALPPVPGERGATAAAADASAAAGGATGAGEPPVNSRQHIYHLVDDGKGDKTPTTERTIMVDVPAAKQPVPTSGYQVPKEDMEGAGSEAEATLTRHYRSSVRYNEPPSNIHDMYAHLDSRTYQRLQRAQVALQTEVGKGEFGTVFAGLWHRQAGDVHVAVKILQDGGTEKERVRFLREAAIMGQFSHRNIVKLIGVVAESDPLYIVLELMQDSLKNYLKSLRPGMPSAKDFGEEKLACHLLGMCKDVASGMAYLDHKGFIHRDLAARNVMIDSERVCKIGDFGLARDLDGGASSYYVSQGGKVPIKWTAPEAIFFRKYSSASDVWSYGILLFEIWSLAAEPYAWWDNKETFEKVRNGYRLAPPAGCPLNMYEMMIQCWHPEPHERPPFREMLQRLELTDQDHLLLISSGLTSNQLGDAGNDLDEQQSHYRTLQRRFAGQMSSAEAGAAEVQTCV